MQGIVEHHKNNNGSLELNIDWDGDYLEPWKQRIDFNDDAVWQYLRLIRQNPLRPEEAPLETERLRLCQPGICHLDDFLCVRATKVCIKRLY